MFFSTQPVTSAKVPETRRRKEEVASKNKSEIKKVVGQVVEISPENVTILFTRKVTKGNEIAIAISGKVTIDFDFDGVVIRDKKTGILTEKESVNAGDKVMFALLGALICKNAEVYIKIPEKPLTKRNIRR